MKILLIGEPKTIIWKRLILTLTLFNKNSYFHHLTSCFLYCVNTNFRNSRTEVYCKKGVLRNFRKFTENSQRATLLKKRPWHKCEISSNPFFIESLWWLFLKFAIWNVSLIVRAFEPILRYWKISKPNFLKATT